MSERKEYSEAQLDLLRRIERMDVSDELRRDIRDLREEKSPHRDSQPEVVKGESRVVGFTRNS